MSRSESMLSVEQRARRAPWRSTLLVAALAGVAALAFAGAAGATQVRPAAGVTHTVARCSTSELVIWLDTTGNGAAGSTYFNIEFTNLGKSSCTLVGFPGVSAIGLSGAQVGLAAGRDNPGTEPVVDLVPDGSATAVLRVTDTGNYPRTDCRQVLAAGLRVYPPGSTTAKTVAYPFDACSLTKETFLHVRPIGKGVLPQ